MVSDLFVTVVRLYHHVYQPICLLFHRDTKPYNPLWQTTTTKAAPRVRSQDKLPDKSGKPEGIPQDDRTQQTPTKLPHFATLSDLAWPAAALPLLQVKTNLSPPDPMDIDPMEIGRPPPQQAQPAPTTTLTRINEQAQNSGMHRQKFYLSIGPRPMPTLDLDVLTVARAEVTRLQRAGLPVLESLPERAGPHLYIRIDTDQASRDQALARADLRMGIMQDMIRDGFGWFSGLPYRHPHFEVKFLRGPRL